MGCIKKHNYKPEYIFHKLGDEEELYLGVELEVDIGGEDENNAAKVLELLNSDNQENVYCMHDSSLNSGNNSICHTTTGFEIVTMPCTFNYHKTLNYKNAFDFLTQKGYKSHDTSTCGLHIHVNRNYFGADKLTQDLNICKLMFLFEIYWDNIALIARRSDNHYARRSAIEDNESLIDLYSKSKRKGKYAAINLEHQDTIEIRIFRGTLNYETYMLTLEFVYDMCHVVKETDIYDIQLLKWFDIESYFSQELIAYIEKRKTIKEMAQTKTIMVNYEGSIGWDQSNNVVNRRIAINQLPIIGMDIARASMIEDIDSIIFASGSSIQSIPEPPRRVYLNEEYQHQTQEPTVSMSPMPQRTLSPQEKIKMQIKNLRREIKLSTNELEKLNLRRKLMKLEQELTSMIRARN